MYFQKFVLTLGHYQKTKIYEIQFTLQILNSKISIFQKANFKAHLKS